MNDEQLMWFEGNFKEYDADLRRRKGADADTPHPVTMHPVLAAVLGAERFLAEIRRPPLQHPHILPLFDSGTVNG